MLRFQYEDHEELVADYAAASAAWLALRARLGLDDGADGIPRVLDEEGNEVALLSHNGRVWPSDKDWQLTDEGDPDGPPAPLYEPEDKPEDTAPDYADQPQQGSLTMTLDELLDTISVAEVDESLHALLGWFYVADDDSVIAYFPNEAAALRHRLSTINDRLNPTDGWTLR